MREVGCEKCRDEVTTWLGFMGFVKVYERVQPCECRLARERAKKAMG